jgi:dTDP-4-amino-4,6-dideoxygalactose transaminase
MPVHQQLAYQSKCIIRTSLKNAEQACTEVLSLPIYPELKTEEIEQVINALKLGLGEL